MGLSLFNQLPFVNVGRASQPRQKNKHVKEGKQSHLYYYQVISQDSSHAIWTNQHI